MDRTALVSGSSNQENKGRALLKKGNILVVASTLQRTKEEGKTSYTLTDRRAVVNLSEPRVALADDMPHLCRVVTRNDGRVG